MSGMEAGQKGWEQEGEVRNGRVPRCSGSSLHRLMAQSTQDVNTAEKHSKGRLHGDYPPPRAGDVSSSEY